MNKNNLTKKEGSVFELENIIKTTKSFVIFEYQGLSAIKIQDLRKKFTLSNGKIVVEKNTLISRAVDNLKLNNFDKTILSGPNAFGFGGKDEIAPFSIISKLAEDQKTIKIKGGYFENKYISASVVKQLASLPSREQLYTSLASMLLSPVRGVARAIKAVADNMPAASSVAPAVAA